MSGFPKGNKDFSFDYFVSAMLLMIDCIPYVRSVEDSLLAFSKASDLEKKLGGESLTVFRVS